MRWYRFGEQIFADEIKHSYLGRKDFECPELIKSIQTHLYPITDKHIKAMSDELKTFVSPYNAEELGEIK